MLLLQTKVLLSFYLTSQERLVYIMNSFQEWNHFFSRLRNCRKMENLPRSSVVFFFFFFFFFYENSWHYMNDMILCKRMPQAFKHNKELLFWTPRFEVRSYGIHYMPLLNSTLWVRTRAWPGKSTPLVGQKRQRATVTSPIDICSLVSKHMVKTYLDNIFL